MEDDKEEEFSRFVEQYTTTQELLMDYEYRQLWVAAGRSQRKISLVERIRQEP